MPKLKIDDIVNVTVTREAVKTRLSYNTGLIVGETEVIPAEARCAVYGSLDAMLDEGFKETDALYRAAALYFAQAKVPERVVIGARSGGETWVEAIRACREANPDWYAVYIAVDEAPEASEAQAVAAYMNTLRGAYFFDSADPAALQSGDGDLFSLLNRQGIHNAVGIYSRAAFAGAALMGYGVGANDGTAGSAFTLAYKRLNGIEPDDLTETQVRNLQNKCANYYIRRGGSYRLVEQGVTSDGTFFDEVIGLDQLANDLQLACMDVLANADPKIPGTNAGALEFVLACNNVCEDAWKRGFVAEGVWRGKDVMNLSAGDTLPKGYLVQVEPVENQSAEDRRKRKAPPIYVAAILAGAIHSATVKVIVE